MIARAINGEQITVYGDGKAIRDYIYVDDVAEGHFLALKYGKIVEIVESGYCLSDKIIRYPKVIIGK